MGRQTGKKWLCLNDIQIRVRFTNHFLKIALFLKRKRLSHLCTHFESNHVSCFRKVEVSLCSVKNMKNWIYPSHHRQYIIGYLYADFKEEILYINIIIYELFYALAVLNQGILGDKNAFQYSLIIACNYVIVLLSKENRKSECFVTRWMHRSRKKCQEVSEG